MTRLLLPQRKALWAPSQRLCVFGRENQTRFRLTAKLRDGHVMWRGWFDDRDDADEFIRAIGRHVLYGDQVPREVIRLTDFREGPYWSDYLTSLDVGYEFATLTFLTSPTGSNQTFNVLVDWNNAANFGETLGGGGSGGANGRGGGGAGAFSQTPNMTLTLGGTETYQIGSLGSGGDSAGGTDSWFGATTLAGSKVGSKAGAGGTTVGNAQGGAAGSGIGTTKKSGGNGGAITGGGGGAASLAGDGSAGSDLAGGTGGASGSGLAGGSTGVNGANGTEWDSTHGSGSGGGGTPASALSGTGGRYGAGGGGGGAGSGTNFGPGFQGIVVLTNTPIIFMPFKGWEVPDTIVRQVTY